MGKGKTQREQLFKTFSQNLEWVKEHPQLKRFFKDFKNGYICPLCENLFFEKDLDVSLSNFLTLEDVPPKSLGGKPKTLTCKDCNSKSGYALDANLLNRLMELDFTGFLPNSKISAKFQLNNNEVNGHVEIDKDGVVKMHMLPNKSNPVHAENFTKDFVLTKTREGVKTPVFKIKQTFRSNERKAEIAALRIAYLMAYSIFGYGFIVNHASLNDIRKQLLNPDEDILPRVFWIKYDFPDDCLGLNIITSPVELQCFLIVFDVKTKSKSRRFAIALPGISNKGVEIYKNLELFNNKEEAIELKFETLDSSSYLGEKNLALSPHYFWDKHINKRDFSV